MRIARRFSRHELGGYIDAIATARRLEKAAPSTAPEVFLCAVRGLVVSSPVTIESLTPALEWFNKRRCKEQDARAYLVCASALTHAGEKSLSLSVAWLFRRIAVGPEKMVKNAGKDLDNIVRKWTGGACGFKLAAMLPYLHTNSPSDLLMLDYLAFVRTAELVDVNPIPADVLINLSKNRGTDVSKHVFSELYRRWQAPPIKAMEKMMQRLGTDEGWPEAVTRSIAFHARYGDLNEARRLARVMLKLQRTSGIGASLWNSHRALTALAEKEEGVAGDMYKLAASLLFLGNNVDDDGVDSS